MPSAMTTAAPPEKIPFRIHLLRAANPLTLKLLDSRLHFLMSRDLLIASFRGRKSGRQFTTPLSYVEVDGLLYLCTRPEVSNWWKNMRGGAAIELTLRGKRARASATVLDRSSDEGLVGFRAFLNRNPRTARLLYHVAVEEDGTVNAEDVLREFPRSVVVRVDPGIGHERGRSAGVRLDR